MLDVHNPLDSSDDSEASDNSSANEDEETLTDVVPLLPVKTPAKIATTSIEVVNKSTELPWKPDVPLSTAQYSDDSDLENETPRLGPSKTQTAGVK